MAQRNAKGPFTSKRNSLDLLKTNDYKHLQLRAKRKSREISVSDLNDLSTLRRRQQIKRTVLRCKRKDGKFRSDIAELKGNLNLIKYRLDLMVNFTTLRRNQSDFRKRWIKFNRQFWKQVPLLEELCLQAALVIFASLIFVHVIRALVSALFPQIFMECHPLITFSMKNYSLCAGN